MTRIQIPVQGMRCEGCERTVQASLTKVDGVRDAKADHQAGRVQVSFDPERVDEQRLRAQIEEAGYPPVKETVS
jgi:copper chaperone CopZ